MAQSVFTLSDAVDHLIDFGQGQRGTNRSRMALRAVESAVSRLASMHAWKCLSRQMEFRLSRPVYGTCNVSTDSQSGRTIATLSSGSWPDWVDLGRIEFQNAWGEVAARITDSIVELSGSGVREGTAKFTLVRDRYLLPDIVGSVLEVRIGRDYEYLLMPVQTGQELAQYDQVNRPVAFDVRDAGEYYGRHMLVTVPAPSVDEPVIVQYRAEIRPPRLEYWEGSGKVSPDGSSIVLTSGMFPEIAVGSIIRIHDTAPATGAFGNNRVSRNDNVTPIAERTIVELTTANTALLDARINAEVSGKVVVSDPIDVDRGAMQNAFLRLAEEDYLVLTGSTASQVEVARRAASLAVRDAQRSDAKVSVNTSQSNWYSNHYPFNVKK